MLSALAQTLTVLSSFLENPSQSSQVFSSATSQPQSESPPSPVQTVHWATLRRRLQEDFLDQHSGVSACVLEHLLEDDEVLLEHYSKSFARRHMQDTKASSEDDKVEEELDDFDGLAEKMEKENESGEETNVELKSTDGGPAKRNVGSFFGLAFQKDPATKANKRHAPTSGPSSAEDGPPTVVGLLQDVQEAGAEDAMLNVALLAVCAFVIVIVTTFVVVIGRLSYRAIRRNRARHANQEEEKRAFKHASASPAGETSPGHQHSPIYKVVDSEGGVISVPKRALGAVGSPAAAAHGGGGHGQGSQGLANWPSRMP